MKKINVLTKNDVVNCLGVIFLSLISFGSEFIPIIIGFIEKRVTSKHKKIIFYVFSFIIVMFLFSFQIGMKYIINVILVYTLLEILRGFEIKNIKAEMGAVFTATFLSQMFWSLFENILVYDLVISIAIALATMLGYYIFNGFEFDIKNLNEKNFIVFIVGIAIALVTFKKVTIFSLSVKDIVSIYIILNFAYLKGAKYSVLAGLIIGAVGEIASPNMGVAVISFTLGALMASVVGQESKIKTVMGFLLGNSILAYYITGYNILALKFIEVFAAGTIFIITYKKVNMFTSFINDDVLMLTESSNELVPYEENIAKTSNALENMSGAIENINCSSEDKDIFNLIKEKVCVNCNHIGKCWGENYDNTTEAIFSAIEEYEDTGQIDMDYFETLQGYNFCDSRDKIIKNIIDRYREYRESKTGISFDDLKRCMAGQLKGISRYIFNITTKVKNESRNIEEKIVEGFENINIPVEKVKIDFNEKNCELQIKDKSGVLKENIDKVNAILSRALNKRIVNSDERCKDFKEVEKYRINTGIATANAYNQNISGDTYKLIDFYNDKYIMVLSDGMGVGEKAKQMSNVLVEMFSDMIKSDFDSETITTLIGSFMQYISDSEKIITLDSTNVNLITGECELIKIGGAPTFLIKDGYVDIICCDSLPMGILEEVDFYKEKRSLKAGDILVSLSDGVIDSKRDVVNKEFWVSGFLKNLYIDEPQVIAEELLTKTIENYNGRVLDDITVIVQKVE